MKALIIGGERHGEFVDVLDGAQAWVDIRSATTHRIRVTTWNILDPRTNAVTEAYSLPLAVHEELLGPSEPMIVPQLLQLLAMNEFARSHGVAQDIPKEPAASDLIVPGQQ